MRPVDKVILLAALVVIAATVVVGQFDLVPQRAICWSVILFGVKCAGCGLTRSFAALGRGDVPAAFTLNPLGPFLFGWVVALAASRLLKLLAPRFGHWRAADSLLAVSAAIMILCRLTAFYLV